MDKKQMEENIKNYGKSIKTIESFTEAVRQSPGMYIGPIGNDGFINMIREVFQNSIDELIKVSSPCTEIWVNYNEITHEVIIKDNGRGIPFNDIIRIYTSEHTSSNYIKQEGEYSSGLHGIGAKVTNALSTVFIVESYILGEAKKVEFYDGIPWDKGIVDIKNKNNIQGTSVYFRPYYEIMGNISVKIEEVIMLIKSILHLTKIGAVVHFSGIFLDGKEYKEEIFNEDGLLYYLIMQTTNPLIKPIIGYCDTGKMKVEFAFTFDLNINENIKNIVPFCNMCPISQDSTPVLGFVEGVCRYFKNYMNKIYLVNTNSKKKNQLQVVNNDVKEFLVGVVSANHIKPNFTGQAKEKISNEDLYQFVLEAVMNSLDNWSKSNSSNLQKLCKSIKEIAEFRIGQEKNKNKLRNKYANSLTGLPAKFIEPKGKENLEFIIVEGDSACGSARNNRDNDRQGIFPIRGKLPNALTATNKAEFLANSEVDGIITIVGGGCGKNFNLNKVKWEKIIFMPDADPDGAHIATLLLKLFMIYMRPLIEDGRVYKAIPPLYGMKKGNKTIYFTTRYEYISYLQEIFTKNNTISTLRGNILTDKEIMNILYNNVEYTHELEIISNRYSINPYLLETITENIDKSFESLKNIVEKTYRFMTIEKIKNTTVIKGLVDCKYQTIFLNDKFKNDIKNINNILYSADIKRFNINNNQSTLYQLMKLFESSSPNNITRYKGLGEMNPSQLGESTVLPSENRTLIRYTMDSAIKEIDMIKFLENNKQELTKDIKATRLDLLG